MLESITEGSIGKALAPEPILARGLSNAFSEVSYLLKYDTSLRLLSNVGTTKLLLNLPRLCTYYPIISYTTGTPIIFFFIQ